MAAITETRRSRPLPLRRMSATNPLTAGSCPVTAAPAARWQGRREYFGEVDGGAPGSLADLLAAAEAVGDHGGLRGGVAHGGKQGLLADRLGHAIVCGLEPERAGHAAAAGARARPAMPLCAAAAAARRRSRARSGRGSARVPAPIRPVRQVASPARAGRGNRRGV